MIVWLRSVLVVVLLMALGSIYFSSLIQQETVVDYDLLLLAPILLPHSNKNDKNDNTATRERNVAEFESSILHHKRNDDGTRGTLPKANTPTPSLVCRPPACFDSLASNLSRAFPDRTNHTWIIRSTTNAVVDVGRNYTCAGILYVKNFKAASSTAAGAALRIAVQYNVNANANVSNPPPRAWVKFHHTPAHSYRLRDPQRSILFSSVRDPAARALSRIFYSFASRWGFPMDDASVLKKLQSTDPQFGAVSHAGGGYQVKYLSLQPRLPKSWTTQNPTTVVDPHSIQSTVRDIFEEYDFILVAERMDESLVAMALVLGVSITDVLVQSAKGASLKYHYFKHGKREHCQRPVPAFRSPAVQAYLESDEWYAKNYGDYLLHAAAHGSLNRTIQRLGPQRFARSLHEYRRLKAKAERICANQTVYHCSVDGKPQRHLSKLNCYGDDSGCGYPCIDQMLLLDEQEETKMGKDVT